MSERLLEAFREETERSTPLPDFELIAAAGRDRRRRRRTVVAAVTACAVGASALLATTYGEPAAPQPAKDPDGTSLVTPYPTMTNTTLEAGIYELQPSTDTARPRVRLALPAGWNSSLGPNRFEGLDEAPTDDPRANQEALESDPEWLLGMVVVDAKWIARSGCTMTDVTGGGTTALVQALTTVPRLAVTSGPESTVRFGHPAVHLQLREQGGRDTCPQDTVITTAEAALRYLGRGTTIDAWVVDVDGRPLLVWAAWTAGTPSAEVTDLLGVVDSLELVDDERP